MRSHEASGLKIDFCLLHGDQFERATFDRRVLVEYFETPAWIATAEDLILHKLYWNGITPSDRQLHDAAAVFAVQAESLDRAYLRNWARKLNVEQPMDDILSGRIKPKST